MTCSLQMKLVLGWSAFLPWGQRSCVNILRAKDGEPGDEARGAGSISPIHVPRQSDWPSVLMANQSRGGRLGVLSGRLRGGFTASSLPGSRPNCSSPLLEQAATSPLGTASSSPSWGGGESHHEGSSFSEDSTASNASAQLFTTLRAVHETIKKVDRRISSVEQQQLKLATSVKELTTLIKNNERSSFTIKGSTWEVSHLKIQSSIVLYVYEGPCSANDAPNACSCGCRRGSLHTSPSFVCKLSVQ